MKFNKKVIIQLQEAGLNVNESLTTLLILYFNIEKNNLIMKNSYISELSKIGLIEYNFTNKIYKIKCELFEEKIIPVSDEFVKKYIDKFRNVNKARTAPTAEVKKRINKLRTEVDKTITDDEILKAVDLHIQRLSSPEYIKQADYFIWGRDCGFYCMKYIEEIRQNPTTNTSQNPFEQSL